MIDEKTEQRFWPKVNKNSDKTWNSTPCWAWLAATVKDGYGGFRIGGRIKGRMEGAHRIAWELYLGPIPKGMHVLHHCDNPACVNPLHLFIGDNKINTEDKVRKGRQPKGEKHPSHKLTWEIVTAIRQVAADLDLHESFLAKIYRVSRRCINQILNNETWQPQAPA